MQDARKEHASNVTYATAHFAHPHRNVAALKIDPGMRVADFGSGSGAYVLAIAEAMHGTGHVYAIDIQKDLLRRTKSEASARGLHNVEVLWGDLESEEGSKIADDTLEFVLISNLLFQVSDKRGVLLEARRIVRPSGRIAVIDWSDAAHRPGPHRDHRISKQEVRTLARSVDIEFESEFPAGAHHFGLMFRKKVTHTTT